MFQDHTKIIQGLLDGEFSEEGQGHLVHPFVKLIFVVVPLLLATIWLTVRYQNIVLDSYMMLGLIITILFCQSIDFRPDGLNKTLKFFTFLILGWTAIIISKFVVIQNNNILELLNFRKKLEIIGKYITFEDTLIIMLFATSARGITRLYITDVVWLGRLLFFKNLKIVYYTIIITYFVIKKTFSEMFNTAFYAAKNRAKLVRSQKGRIKALETWALLFIQKFLSGLSELAVLTHSLLTEKGFFSGVSKNTIKKKISIEDWVALLFLSISIFVILIFKI
jgi:hypothetical protein